MKRVYFILGCTAVGKGSAARELAGRIGAQIVSVDSMKIYRRMDIGTAKPPRRVLAEIPHHCIDIAEPSESFSVAQYVEHADLAIERITDAALIPLAVGGTSLYIKALTMGLFEGPSGDAEIRLSLARQAEAEGLDALHEDLSRIDPAAAQRIHRNDKRRIIRALEVYQLTGKGISELQQQWDSPRWRYDCVFIGLRRDKEDLNRRINARATKMIQAGLKDEIASLLAEPTEISAQAAQAVGYAEMIDHLRRKMTLNEALEQIKINTRRLAKKQRTWYRRFPNVHWFDVGSDDTAAELAEKIISAGLFSPE